MNPWGDESCAGKKDGNKLIRNILKIIDTCKALGVWWIIDNPAIAILGDLPLLEFQREENVETAVADQCVFDLKDLVSQLFFLKTYTHLVNFLGLS